MDNREELFEAWDNARKLKSEFIAKREAAIKEIYKEYAPALDRIDNEINEILKQIDKL